ncbi:LysR substrate-binding domain-containing protein [Cupriavidus sp. a3]|uniref:LysR substrate-binding domain-containing protein n=1 Tax=Cupriavidus sp. a3 TaxID=3242158 RepID=UPI003D9C2268
MPTIAKLPPLNTLRAFEAAARHCSFALAAGELSVTSNAISHQIKNLETHLGVTLFERLPRGLVLTEAAKKFYPRVHSALEDIRSAASQLELSGDRQLVSVTAPAAFAIGWLLPRLQRFHLENPDVELRISTLRGEIDLSNGEIDGAIFHGHGERRDLEQDYLFGDVVIPVCSPTYLASRTQQQSSQTLLLNETLLFSTLQPDDWSDWFAHASVKPLQAPRYMLSFGNTTLPIQAAIKGLGYALADVNLIEEELREARLVAPLKEPGMVRGTGWYLSYLNSAEASHAFENFRRWIQRESRKQ